MATKRRVKIRKLEPIKIFNVTRKNLPLFAKKNYNKYRGTEGVIYGFQKSTGKFIVNIGQEHGVSVNARNVEFLNSSEFVGVPCDLCGLKPHEHTQEEMFSIMGNAVKNRNMNTELYVEQGEFKIIPKKAGQLYTYGLTTCVALGFNLGNYQFLSHISSLTNVDKIIEAVCSIKGKPSKVKLWVGLGDDADAEYILEDPSGRALKLAYKITDALEIKDITVKHVCFAEIVP